MLEYIKTVLSKVSFDRYLFMKEYNKANKYLSASELKELKEWASQKFPKHQSEGQPVTKDQISRLS